MINQIPHYSKSEQISWKLLRNKTLEPTMSQLDLTYSGHRAGSENDI